MLVARRIGDDKTPPRRSEVAVCHVDGDALFPLGLKPVKQERGIELISDGAVFFGIPLQSTFLVFKDQRCVEQKPPDQRRLAVVDRPAGQKPELVALRRRSFHQRRRLCAL